MGNFLSSRKSKTTSHGQFKGALGATYTLLERETCLGDFVHKDSNVGLSQELLQDIGLCCLEKLEHHGIGLREQESEQLISDWLRNRNRDEFINRKQRDSLQSLGRHRLKQRILCDDVCEVDRR